MTRGPQQVREDCSKKYVVKIYDMLLLTLYLYMDGMNHNDKRTATSRKLTISGVLEYSLGYVISYNL